MHTEKRKRGELGMYGGALFWASLGSGLTLCSQLIIGWDQTVGESKWWEIMAALGTLAAVIVALSHSHRDEKRRQRETLLRAQLVALSMRLTIAKACGTWRHIRNTLQAQPNVLILPAIRKVTLDALNEVSTLLSVSQAEALAGAPNRCAQKVATLIAHFESLELVLSMDHEGDDSMESALNLAKGALAISESLRDNFKAAKNWA